jgi:hypothetical protein
MRAVRVFTLATVLAKSGLAHTWWRSQTAFSRANTATPAGWELT